MLIFEKSTGQTDECEASTCPDSLPKGQWREQPLGLPNCSELEVVRHYTRLSQDNFCIDTHFYPLGSCTMKYNPKVAHVLATMPGFCGRHPHAHVSKSQGVLSCLYELQSLLAEISGMDATSLVPMAGAQGEFAGIAMIKKYHESCGQGHKDHIIIPKAAHGTNPASARMCGYDVKELPAQQNGDIDLDQLKQMINDNTAAIMLTNPSTLGVFESQVGTICQLAHDHGALMYYDGANLNAILGRMKPASMGFDVMHFNLHKTFATPHGGGGPGAGPVACTQTLSEFLPCPRVIKQDDGVFRWATELDYPLTIGRLSLFGGNIGVLLRAFVYIKMLGSEGMARVSGMASLNANYLAVKLSEMGYVLAFPQRRASHEFVITLKNERQEYGVSAQDVAKALLDHQIHAPTMYFPLMVPECLLIEPTETESLSQMDLFLEAMQKIRHQIENDPGSLNQAPHQLKYQRPDETLAAKSCHFKWKGNHT